MRKVIKHLSILSLLVLFFSAAPLLSFAEDTKDGQLLYDLNYDKDKSVLTGKSKPNANVFINELAGSIVADDDGNFEIPIPKDLKESTVLMLDAVGETSTDLKFNFEKNTVETEETTSSSSTSGSSNSSSSSSSSESKDAESEKESKTSETENETDSTSTSSDEMSTESSSKSSVANISSESYSSETEEHKRSLVWLWTLLIVLGVIGLAVASYLWYKKKLEKEEKQRKSDRRKRSSKKKTSKSLEDDFEDDLYESLKIPAEVEKETRKSRHSSKKELDSDDLDALINSELEKTTKHRKSSGNGKRRKKKSKR